VGVERGGRAAAPCADLVRDPSQALRIPRQETSARTSTRTTSISTQDSVGSELGEKRHVLSVQQGEFDGAFGVRTHTSVRADDPVAALKAALPLMHAAEAIQLEVTPAESDRYDIALVSVVSATDPATAATTRGRQARPARNRPLDPRHRRCPGYRRRRHPVRAARPGPVQPRRPTTEPPHQAMRAQRYRVGREVGRLGVAMSGSPPSIRSARGVEQVHQVSPCNLRPGVDSRRRVSPFSERSSAV
jgi:hypothetical protein